jgi:hypothetical protein
VPVPALVSSTPLGGPSEPTVALPSATWETSAESWRTGSAAAAIAFEFSAPARNPAVAFEPSTAARPIAPLVDVQYR